MLPCRYSNGGYALCICPGCKYQHRLPFSCKTRLRPSCGKVRVDNWVDGIARDLHDVPHLHITLAALDALPLRFLLFDLEPLPQTFQHLKWRELIKASFGYDPLERPRCGRTLQLAEIWELKRDHIWMPRWLETHRMRKAARQALAHLGAEPRRHRQLAFNLNFET